MPSLTTVGGALQSIGVGPERLRFPSLESVAEYVALGDIDGLVEVDLSSLSSADWMTFQNLDALLSLELPSLTDVTDFYVTGNAQLHTLSAPQLDSVGGSLTIEDNASLTTCIGGAFSGVGDCP